MLFEYWKFGVASNLFLSIFHFCLRRTHKFGCLMAITWVFHKYILLWGVSKNSNLIITLRQAKGSEPY